MLSTLSGMVDGLKMWKKGLGRRKAKAAPGKRTWNPLDLEVLGQRITPVTRSWDGGPMGTGDSWHVAANWSGDTLPGVGDVADLSGSNGFVKVTSNVAVASLQMQGGFAGDVLQIDGATLTVGGGYQQDGDINLLNGGAFVIDDGVFTLSGGDVDYGLTVSGSGDFTTTNDGVLAVNRGNNYFLMSFTTSGVTEFNNGSVQLGGASTPDIIWTNNGEIHFESGTNLIDGEVESNNESVLVSNGLISDDTTNSTSNTIDAYAVNNGTVSLQKGQTYFTGTQGSGANGFSILNNDGSLFEQYTGASVSFQNEAFDSNGFYAEGESAYHAIGNGTVYVSGNMTFDNATLDVGGTSSTGQTVLDLLTNSVTGRGDILLKNGAILAMTIDYNSSGHSDDAYDKIVCNDFEIDNSGNDPILQAEELDAATRGTGYLGTDKKFIRCLSLGLDAGHLTGTFADETPIGTVLTADEASGFPADYYYWKYTSA